MLDFMQLWKQWAALGADMECLIGENVAEGGEKFPISSGLRV